MEEIFETLCEEEQTAGSPHSVMFSKAMVLVIALGRNLSMGHETHQIHR